MPASRRFLIVGRLIPWAALRARFRLHAAGSRLQRRRPSEPKWGAPPEKPHLRRAPRWHWRHWESLRDRASLPRRTSQTPFAKADISQARGFVAFRRSPIHIECVLLSRTLFPIIDNAL